MSSKRPDDLFEQAGEQRALAFLGFEDHFIRGHTNMTTRVGLALAVVRSVSRETNPEYCENYVNSTLAAIIWL